MTAPRHPSFPPNAAKFPGSTYNWNPGNIASLHKRARDIMPIWTEGVNVVFKKNLDINRVLMMNWVIGNNTPFGFRVGGELSKKIDGTSLKSPTISGDTNPSSFATNMQFAFHPFSKMRFQFKSQTGPYPYKKYGDTTTSLEYFGQSTTTTLSVYNPKKQSGRMTLGVLQNFTKKFCFGVEMLAEWNRGSFNSQMALASRYTGKDFSVAATVSKEAFDLSYWCQIHTNQQLGSSLIINSRTSKAIGSFFYQLEYRDAVIRGMVDSNWSLGFTYTKLLQNFPSAFGFSIFYCVPTSKFYCGLKFDLDSNLQ